MASLVLTAAMALSGCGGDSAGLLQKFLDTSKAYNALPVVKHTPAYRLAPVGCCKSSSTLPRPITRCRW